MAEQIQDALRRLFHGFDKEARFSIPHLQGNAAHPTAYDGFAFPQGFGHSQAEALTGGLLHHHRGHGLERGHFHRAHTVEVVEHVDVHVFPGVAQHPV